MLSAYSRYGKDPKVKHLNFLIRIGAKCRPCLLLEPSIVEHGLLMGP